jgi:hypothetical protein
MMSIDLPEEISTQELHSLHGSDPFLYLQFTAFEKILATVVFPTPLGPVKR